MVSKEQANRILIEIGVIDKDCELIFHYKTDPEYMAAALSHYWDTPREWAVLKMDGANEGIVIYGKYKRGWETPWSSRHLVRVLLTMLGYQFPVPTQRGENGGQSSPTL